MNERIEVTRDNFFTAHADICDDIDNAKRYFISEENKAEFELLLDSLEIGVDSASSIAQETDSKPFGEDFEARRQSIVAMKKLIHS